MALDVDDGDESRTEPTGGPLDKEAIPPLDKLVKVYRSMSAKMQKLTAEYETKFESIKEQQDQIKNVLKDQMLALAVTSLRTSQGTVTLGTKTRYSTKDWDSFKKFVIDNEAVDLLEKRIAQTNMATFLKDNPGSVPPGLNTFTEYTVGVRRPTVQND